MVTTISTSRSGSRITKRVAELLAEDSWRRTPEPDENGYVAYDRGGVRLEVAFLARDENGEVYTPLREGRGSWPEGSFEGHVAELRGVRAPVMSLRALRADKLVVRDDAGAAAKDRADVASLAGLG